MIKTASSEKKYLSMFKNFLSISNAYMCFFSGKLCRIIRFREMIQEKEYENIYFSKFNKIRVL